MVYPMKLIFTLSIMRKQEVIKWSAVRIKYLYPNGGEIFIPLEYKGKRKLVFPLQKKQLKDK